MSLTYQQNLLIDCSQVRAVSSTNKSFTNNIPEEINLNPRDTIQIYSAFINNKSSADTIEITGDEVIALNNDGSNNQFFKIKDNEVELTLSFYKNATGINTIPMPYGFFLSSLQKNAIVMRDGVLNCGLEDRISGNPMATASSQNGFDDYNTFWFQWSQDNQETESTNGNSIVQTFAVCADASIIDQRVTRLGALPTGNQQATDDYTGSGVNINQFKTYLGDVCQELDGSRCVAYKYNSFEAGGNNKYEKFTKKVKIEIKKGSYSPSNLGDIITNQLGLSEKEITKAVDENLDKNGFYITTPTTDLDDALYISREKIDNQVQSYEEDSALVRSVVYPSCSPLVSRTNVTSSVSTTKNTNLSKFKPDIDTYFECGKTDQTLTTITSGDGFEPTGERSKSYLWSMNKFNNSGLLEPVNVYFRYPKSLEAGQNLVENHGLDENLEHIIDFNYDVKNKADHSPITSPDPSIPPNSFGSKTGSDEDADGYALVKGDYGYIITNHLYTSENLLLWKKWFDSQLEENNIENCYTYDYINFHPSRTSPTYPVDRNDTVRGKLDTVDDEDNPTSVSGNRWINIGMNNNLNTSSFTGGTSQLLNTDGSFVYNDTETKYPLMKFSSDFVGDDDRVDDATASTNIHYSFNNVDYHNHGGYTTYLIGNSELTTIAGPGTSGQISPNGLEYSYNTVTNTGKLNGLFDINSKTIKHICHTQLISIKNSYTDKNGNSKPFIHPLPETKFFEDLGYGIMYPYTSSNDLKQYIMFYVDKQSGGLQKTVLPFVDVNEEPTQALGWIPFFSSHGNQAIMSSTGQGSGISDDAKLDNNDGDIELDEYKTSLTQTGIGATSSGAELVFDDVVSRYTLQNFYTPIISSNFYNFDGTSTQENPNVGNEIVSYNVNNKFYYKVTTGYNNALILNSNDYFIIHNSFNYVLPYNYKETIGNFKGDGVLNLYYSQTGCYIDKWIEIKDETTGDIFLDENEYNFNKSLWFKLGFTYEQTHNNIIKNLTFDGKELTNDFRNSSTINQNGAIDNQKYYSIPITNNTDVLNVQFDNLLFENRDNFNMFLNNPANSVNSLEIISKSTIFIADNLPIRSTDPFFIIESNILSVGGIGGNYFSETSIFSGIDIVEKSFNSNDYYIKDGGITHQVSKPYSINQVTHQIRRNNGLLLDTNQFSAVIYLITKNITIGLTPEQIQEKEELLEQDELKRQQEEKTLEELSGNNLTPKQKLLKSILYKNIIEKRKIKIKETTDDSIEDMLDQEIQEKEDDEGIRIGFNEDGEMINADTNEKITDEQKEGILNRMGLNQTRNPTTVILGRYKNEGILDDDEIEKNVLTNMGEEELFKSVKSFNLPKELKAENLFKGQPDTRMKFPTFADIKPPSERKTKIQKEKIKKSPITIEPLRETLGSRLQTFQPKSETESRLPKPKPFFQKEEEEED